MHLVEDGLVRWALLHGGPDLVKVLGACQLGVAMWVQEAKVAVQLAAIVACELGADTIQGDVQRSPVSLRAHRRAWANLLLLLKLFSMKSNDM